MSGGVKESDWKLFRKLLPQWQAQAMGRLCHEYQEILSDDSKPASERFTAELDSDEADSNSDPLFPPRRRRRVEFQ